MKEKAVITILGTSGNPNAPAQYIFFDEQAYTYANTLPMLLEIYGKDCDIIAFYTKDAKTHNSEILNFYKEKNQKFANLNIDNFFKEQFFIKNEKDFTQIFAQIDQAISDSKYNQIIIDVSHGFRHLPILMTIDMIIQNFSDLDKIEKIIFAKEIQKQKKYEIIDLKEYLDLANIAFILTAFNKNYTVANHIKSTKYPHLIDALQDFSDDIMALNISHLFQTSAQNLITQLNSINDISIQTPANNLKKTIQSLLSLTNFKPYEQYYALSTMLLKKNYILLSLALIFESLRLYVAYNFQTIDKKLYDVVCHNEKGNIYDICNFFIKLLNLEYKELALIYKDPKNFNTKQKKKLKESLQKGKKTYPLTENELIKLQNAFKNKDDFAALNKKIKEKRNTLAHIDSNGTNFQKIKDSITNLITEYERLTNIKH